MKTMWWHNILPVSWTSFNFIHPLIHLSTRNLEILARSGILSVIQWSRLIFKFHAFFMVNFSMGLDKFEQDIFNFVIVLFHALSLILDPSLHSTLPPYRISLCTVLEPGCKPVLFMFKNIGQISEEPVGSTRKWVRFDLYN